MCLRFPVIVCVLLGQQVVADTLSLYFHGFAFSTSKTAVNTAGTGTAFDAKSAESSGQPRRSGIGSPPVGKVSDWPSAVAHTLSYCLSFRCTQAERSANDLREVVGWSGPRNSGRSEPFKKQSRPTRHAPSTWVCAMRFHARSRLNF